MGFRCYRGSVDNVLQRYVKAGKESGAKIIVRITGDCPLIDPKIVDDCGTLHLIHMGYHLKFKWNTICCIFIMKKYIFLELCHFSPL